MNIYAKTCSTNSCLPSYSHCCKHAVVSLHCKIKSQVSVTWTAHHSSFDKPNCYLNLGNNRGHYGIYTAIKTNRSVVRHRDTNIYHVYRVMNIQFPLCAYKHCILNIVETRIDLTNQAVSSAEAINQQASILSRLNSKREMKPVSQ